MKHLSLPKKILLALAILLVLYLIPCFYVSAELNRIVHDSYRTFGKQNNHTQVISDQWFARLNCRRAGPLQCCGKGDLSHHIPPDRSLAWRWEIGMPGVTPMSP